MAKQWTSAFFQKIPTKQAKLPSWGNLPIHLYFIQSKSLHSRTSRWSLAGLNVIKLSWKGNPELKTIYKKAKDTDTCTQIQSFNIFVVAFLYYIKCQTSHVAVKCLHYKLFIILALILFHITITWQFPLPTATAMHH